ncbi:hypothetical protein GCK32_016367 [Trichostrongylus colubriformis]|uniref:SGNH domain-containing protein n=1 Tax=Trichostrongylus colubriformis TaxID=6319 RepID=A0AAN8F716_TRICO
MVKSVRHRLMSPLRLWHGNKVYRKAIREFKPDVLFVLSRYLKTMQLPRSTDHATADKYVLEGANVLRNFSRFVSDKIFVLHAIPRPVLDFEAQYLQTITKPRHIDPTTIVNKVPNLRLAREILERTVKSCRKCALIDYTPLFTINGTFRFFDEHFKIFNLNGYWHFTPLGLHKLRPFYKNICNNITKSNKQ